MLDALELCATLRKYNNRRVDDVSETTETGNKDRIGVVHVACAVPGKSAGVTKKVEVGGTNLHVSGKTVNNNVATGKQQ